jgi:hypothetical protein
MSEIVISQRFNGPPGSGHGGYTCGTVARLVGSSTVEVRLRLPPPLDQPLRWDGARLLDGDDVIAEGRPVNGEPDVEVPEPVPLEAARLASLGYPGFDDHPFPTCFGCGPQRAEGDGLRLFAGPVDGRDVAAAPWVPHPSLLVDDEIPSEVVWAALDCPGAWSALGQIEGTFVLGTLVGSVRSPVAVGKPHVVMGWRIGLDGRKLFCGSALHTATGDLVGLSHQTWIRIA